jgi:hypothetical protein
MSDDAKHGSRSEEANGMDGAPGPDDSGAFRALLRGSLKEPAPSEGTVLRGVQRKLRERSKGRFFGNGWSTTQVRTSYTLMATTMLVLAALAYCLLGPSGLVGVSAR